MGYVNKNTIKKNTVNMNVFESRGNVTVARITPDRLTVTKSKNITVESGHSQILDSIREDKTVYVNSIRLGTGGESGTSVTDTDLNNPVISGDIFRSTLTQNSVRFIGFIGQNFSSGSDIDEVGLVTNNDVLLNHATINPISKDNNSILLITVELQITDNS